MSIRIDPVCGREVEENVSVLHGLYSSYLVRRYYFCSRECKEHFDAEPRKYVVAIDIICGREVDIDDAEDLGLYADHNGKRFHFCSQQCRAKFEVNPDNPPPTGSTGHHHHGGDAPADAI